MIEDANNKRNLSVELIIEGVEESITLNSLEEFYQAMKKYSIDSGEMQPEIILEIPKKGSIPMWMLQNSNLFSSYAERLEHDVITKNSKKTLLDHLIIHKNLKHSLSWYVTRNQALKFGEMLENDNYNHNTELGLVSKIFSSQKINEGYQDSLSVIDVGCGIGDTGFEILRKQECEKINYYPLDSSSYFIALTIDRLSYYDPLKVFRFNSFLHILDELNDSDRDILKNAREIIEMSRKAALNFYDENEKDPIFHDRCKYIDCELSDILARSFEGFSNPEESEFKDKVHEAVRAEDNETVDELFRYWTTWQLRDKGALRTYHITLDPRLSHRSEILNVMDNYNFSINTIEKILNLNSNFEKIKSLTNNGIKDFDDFVDLLVQFKHIIYKLPFDTIIYSEVEEKIVEYIVPNDKGKEKRIFPYQGDLLDVDFLKRTGALIHMRDFTPQFTFLDPVPANHFLTLFLGQTLGNFNSQERLQVLNNLYNLSYGEDFLMLGVELRPSENMEGYAEECNSIAEKYGNGNVFTDETVKLLEVNPESLRFNASYNFETNSVDMEYLVLDDVIFTDGEREVKFAKGEIIPVASSYKFSPGKLDKKGNYGKTELEKLCESVGFSVVGHPAIHSNDQGRPDYMVLLVEK